VVPTNGASITGLPAIVNGLIIESAVFSIKELAVIGDQRFEEKTRTEPFRADLAQPPQLTFPDAAPGIYSLVRINFDKPDGGEGDGEGSDGERVSARIAGKLSSGRSFVLTIREGFSVDLRGGGGMELRPQGYLSMTIATDLGGWFRGIVLDGQGSDTLTIGDGESDGHDTSTFMSNFVNSLRIEPGGS
jgi:hypothetical protein